MNVYKPGGLTSHDVVARARRAFGVKKIGHAGTLDPMADGVLVLCLGAATRLSEYVMQSTKRYRARARLGVTTDTYDAEGRTVRERDASRIQREDVERLLPEFQGDIEQIPPMYSAIKQGGRKLYELARAGQEIERQARQVRIDSLVLTDWSPPQFTLDVTCSAGTYIRSLAYDLGERLGVGAHLTALTRIASGMFALDTAIPLDVLLTCATWQDYLISPEVALAGWPAVRLNDVEETHIRHGRAIPADESTSGALAVAYGADGTLAAIVERDGGLWRPHKVFENELDS